MFSHQNFFHLGINMFAFYSFSPIVLSTLTISQYLILYLGSGIFGNLVFTSPYIHELTNNLVNKFKSNYNDINNWYDKMMLRNRTGLGASGAINGLLMYSICNFPFMNIYLYAIIPIPAIIFGVGIFSYEIYEFLYNKYDTIAHDAHLGGALFGLCYYLLNKRRYIKRF